MGVRVCCVYAYVRVCMRVNCTVGVYSFVCTNPNRRVYGSFVIVLPTRTFQLGPASPLAFIVSPVTLLAKRKSRK